MASVSATIKNGEIVTSASQASLATDNASGSSSMDKDAFLQLLVAQMKYQDPLEPTSNTEYIAQYAQFSQVEALNNMSTTMELSRYSSYVGKEVVIETGGAGEESSQIRGLVDYVTFEGGKAYFSIDGNLYAATDMVSVISSEYTNAEEMAKAFAKEIKDLPSLDQISIANNGNTITALYNTYNALSEYEKGFLDEDDVAKMKQYVSKLNDLLAEAAKKAREEAEAAEKSAKEAEEAANNASTETDDVKAAENAAQSGASASEETENTNSVPEDEEDAKES